MLSGIFNALINHTALELSCPALTINVQLVIIEIYVRVKKSPLRTLPRIDGLEMIFSASRSRRISIVAIIQSLAQFEKTYGREGAEIIVDNCQCTRFGSFAPNSKTAEEMSRSLGTQTVQSGSVSMSAAKDGGSKQLQMIQRPLMTVDELKSMPKGHFVVMKTGCNPMRTVLKLFFDWGIAFEAPYSLPEHSARKVVYADKDELTAAIQDKYPSMDYDEQPPVMNNNEAGNQTIEAKKAHRRLKTDGKEDADC